MDRYSVMSLTDTCPTLHIWCCHVTLNLSLHTTLYKYIPNFDIKFTFKFILLVISDMDLIHKFLNIVAPPFTFFSLALFLPPYWAIKFFLSTIYYIFTENVAGKVVHITGASSGIGEVIQIYHPQIY